MQSSNEKFKPGWLLGTDESDHDAEFKRTFFENLRLREQRREELEHAKNLAAIRDQSKRFPGMQKSTPRKRQERLIARDTLISDIIKTGVKGLKYCIELDKRRVKAPPSWANWPGFYKDAYKASDDWKKKIQHEKNVISTRVSLKPSVPQSAKSL